MAETGGQLSKNDLYILMESYKNNIQLNTTLLEQQKQLMIMNTAAIEKQKEFCSTLDKFIENLTNCSKKLEDNHIKIVDLIDNKTSDIGTKIITMESNNSIEHSKITNKLYVALGGMVLIVIAVINLAFTYADKFNDIIKHLGK